MNCTYPDESIRCARASASVIVSGVKTLNDVLNASIKMATLNVKKLELKPGKFVNDIIAAIG